MTQEDKELLLKDLSARLPYGVKISNGYGIIKLSIKTDIIDIVDSGYIPYLRPMSSATDEEKLEIYNWLVENEVDWFDFKELRLDEILIAFDSSWLLVDWLNSKHFDYRGLIEKGLALEAPEGI